MADLEKAAVLNRVETREPNWYGNNTLFSYEEEVEKEKLEFTSGIKRLSKKTREPPTLQLHKKPKVKDTASSSSLSDTAASTQDDTKYASQRLWYFLLNPSKPRNTSVHRISPIKEQIYDAQKYN